MVIVVGYEGQKLIDYIGTLDVSTPVVFVHNPVYDRTNNIYSLFLAKEYLAQEDTVLLESDIIFEDSVLEALLSDPRDTLALVDRYESWMDGTCLKINSEDEIVGFVSGRDFSFSQTGDYYKTVNLYKFSREFSRTCYIPFLEAYRAALGENEYYEQVLRVIAMLDRPTIRAKRLSGQKWYEIDDIQDLDIAESLFAPEAKERVRRLQERYGGYWRYPKLLDFCYLVNPYFPPRKMKEEMRASFDALLADYPSSARVNSLLAGKNFGVRAENILAGNGAAELIRGLMESLEGKTGFIRPTFEEYPNRYAREDSVCFLPDNPDFAYTADDLMAFFGEHPVDNLVVVNPDNPSGNYIPKADLLRLAEWAGGKGIRLIVDESFADFADEEDNSLLDQAILDANPHLSVMKSISKSYGVPGIRLGVLATGDRELAARLRKDLAIWNINSFGEVFMQILEKYRRDYTQALIRIRQERSRFRAELEKIPGFRVIPSQANYLMAETERDPKELTEALLERHGILIKELTGKTGGKRYIRLAVRNTEENDRLLKALRAETAGTPE